MTSSTPPLTHVFKVQVCFGDCDPAGIVYYPNFQRWMDASSLNYFMACGIPPWKALERSHNIVGTPLLEISTKFVNAGSYPDILEVHTCIESWRGKVFTQLHRVMRGDTLICEGRETRIFVKRLEDGSLKGIELPDFIPSACSLQ
jgi:4-hydroxybenzoyl-CoA thioesterase